MAETYFYDSGVLTTVRDVSVQLTECANMGNVGAGQVIVEDEAGTLELVGEKTFWVNQDDCSVVTNFRGHTVDRTYARGEGSEKVQAARDITLNLVDLNARMGFRVLRPLYDANRPRESVGTRLTWLLATPELTGLVADNGFVDYPTKMMDATHYKSQHPGDVLADCAERVSYNFFVYFDEAANEVSLWFKDSNTSTDWSSSLRISNVLSDIDHTTTFAAGANTQLRRDPERTVAGVLIPFGNNQTEYRTRPATAATYAWRDGTAPNANVKDRDTAKDIADLYLFQHRDEEDIVTTTIQVPSTKVNLVRAGQRISCKFSHYGPEGYASFTWFRVLERTLRPLTKGAALYDMDLTLSPQDEAAPEPACSEDATPDGTYYPLGDLASEDGGFHSNPSDGFTVYLRPGLFYPLVPTPGAESYWHFNSYGAGGAGSIDYAGDCVQNTLQFTPVGPGTLTIQTEIYGGSPRPLAAAYTIGGDWVSLGTFTSGDEIVVDLTGADCVSVVRITDGPGSPCGGKWGWSAAEWAV